MQTNTGIPWCGSISIKLCPCTLDCHSRGVHTWMVYSCINCTLDCHSRGVHTWMVYSWINCTLDCHSRGVHTWMVYSWINCTLDCHNRGVHTWMVYSWINWYCVKLCKTLSYYSRIYLELKATQVRKTLII